MWMLPLSLHVNQKTDYDDDDMKYLSLYTGNCLIQGAIKTGLIVLLDVSEMLMDERQTV